MSNVVNFHNMDDEERAARSTRPVQVQLSSSMGEWFVRCVNSAASKSARSP